MKILILLLIGIFFSACNIGESQQELETKIAQSKEIQIKKIETKNQQELAKIAQRKELAQIQKDQLLQKLRLEMDLEKEKIELQEKKERALLEKKLAERDRADAMEIKRYLMLILTLTIIIASYFIYLYFKRRHENKLKAYHDNLEKYFHQQENMTKMRIAEKIIDTVASGNLDKEQELELIRALGSQNNTSAQGDNTIELIEEKK